jgi:outer membrane lipoprotein-sorting protein
MRTLQTALILAAILCTTACTELGYVEKNDYDAVQAKLSETEKKLKEADKQIADFQAHRYSVYHEGWRTWRMDSVSGTTCILLTTQADWKKPDTKSESCSCEDYLRDTADPYSEPNKPARQYLCGW